MFNASNYTSYASNMTIGAAISYSTGELIRVSHGAVTGSVTTPSVTGSGLSFTQIANTQFNGSWLGQLAVFESLTTQAGSSRITCGVGRVQQVWSIDTFNGMDTTTPRVQASGNSGAATLVLSAFHAATNYNVATFLIISGSTLTQGAGWTSLLSMYGPTQGIGLTIEYSQNTLTARVANANGSHQAIVASEMSVGAASGSNYNVSSLDTATATDTMVITDIYGPYQSSENVLATDAYAYTWQQGPNWPSAGSGGAGWHVWRKMRAGGGNARPRRPF